MSYRKRRISLLEHMNRKPEKTMSYEDIEKYLGLTAEEEAMVMGTTVKAVQDWRWDMTTMPKRHLISMLDDTKARFPVGNTFQAAKHYGLTINEIMKLIRDGSLSSFKRNGKGRYYIWLK